LPALALLADGQGILRLGLEPPVILRGRAVELQVPLEPVRTLTGRRGVGETLARATVQVETGGEVVLRVIGN
jgi:hypothetical protein